MKIVVSADACALGKAAAECGAAAIRDAIARSGSANIVLATGASQFATLASLVKQDVDWSRVTVFHLDEYIAMSADHPASFHRYLAERFLAHVSAPKAMHFIDGNAPDLAAELARLDALIAAHPIDVTFAGIGENGHLAFNDPPADYDAATSFRVVPLDERCRQQQFGEGWFATLAAVPHEAISMTVPQIMRSRMIVLAVPERRKAQPVRDTVKGPVTPMVPASILQLHSDCHLFLDPDSAALLRHPPGDPQLAESGGVRG
jgi:glucosamine-6-phosphate deaminase